MAEDKKEEGKPLTSSAPASTSLTPFEEMDRFFDEFMGRRWPRAWMHPFHWDHPGWSQPGSLAGKLPRIDVIDGETEITVHAELPGVKKEDLDVSVSEDTVTIRGRSSHDEKVRAGSYFRSEIARGEFVRTVGLPGAVDPEKARARMENGVLELVLQKIPKAKRHSVKVE